MSIAAPLLALRHDHVSDIVEAEKPDRTGFNTLADWDTLQCAQRPETPAQTGYSLGDLNGLRGGFAPSRPQVRFWTKDLEGNGLRLVQGTLQLGQVKAQQRGDVIEYTLTGNLFPPVTQFLIPDEIEHELQPVGGTIDDGLIYSEISSEVEGFQPLGIIEPDALEIKTDSDFESWGGRTIRTRHEMTVEFSTCSVNAEVMRGLMQP